MCPTLKVNKAVLLKGRFLSSIFNVAVFFGHMTVNNRILEYLAEEYIF